MGNFYYSISFSPGPQLLSPVSGGDLSYFVECHRGVFAHNEEKLVLDQITENICADASHSNIFIHIPNFQP